MKNVKILSNPKANKNILKSNTHEKLDECKHVKLPIKNPNINNIDKVFKAYIIEHNEKLDYYLVKCEFKLVFEDCEQCPYVQIICKKTDFLADIFSKSY